MTYSSLDDVGAAYYAIEQDAKRNLFAEGDVVMKAIEQGFGVDETVKHCAMTVKCSARTVYRRYAVKQTFGTPNATESWELHAVCADLVDYRYASAELIADQQEQARRWLLKAQSEDLSTRQLKQAMRGASVTDRIVLLDNATVRIFSLARMFRANNYELNLDISPELAEKLNGHVGAMVQVTIVQEVPKVESEAA